MSAIANMMQKLLNTLKHRHHVNDHNISTPKKKQKRKTQRDKNRYTLENNDEFYENADDLEIGARESSVSPNCSPGTRPKLFSYIRNNIIGKDITFNGPFGIRKVVYCDSTASGRSLEFIEDYIKEVVLPTYGNTHTTTSVTSQQTSALRNDARELIARSVNASEEDSIIFAGSGIFASFCFYPQSTEFSFLNLRNTKQETCFEYPKLLICSILGSFNLSALRWLIRYLVCIIRGKSTVHPQFWLPMECVECVNGMTSFGGVVKVVLLLLLLWRWCCCCGGGVVVEVYFTFLSFISSEKCSYRP